MWPAPPARRSLLLPVLCIALLLLGATAALWVALHRPPPLLIDVGGPRDTRFVNGVLEAEIDRATGTTFRWFKPTAQIRLHGAELRPVELALRVHNSQPAAEGARRMRLAYPGWAASVALEPGWRIYRFALPPTPSDAAVEAAPLMIEADALRAPTQDGLARSVAVDWARVQPLPASGPPWRALALLWGLALLAGWLHRLDRWWGRWPAAWRWLRVAVPVGALAAALAWWAAVDPYALAWFLPLPPWALGLATILLAAVGRRQPGVGSRESAIRARLARSGAQSVSLLACALAALLVGQLVLNAQALPALGWGLALLGLGAACLWDTVSGAERERTQPHVAHVRLTHEGHEGHDDSETQPNTPRALRALRGYLRGNGLELAALALIFLSALALRFYRLAELPYGLWRDEARHGIEALHMLNDPAYRPAYILGGVDLPGLGMYPFMLAMWLWGPPIWSMRVVTALAGALTVFPLYALVRTLYGRGAVALLAAALLAVSSWHVTISRFSFPTIFDPLLQLTGLWLLVVGLGGTSTGLEKPAVGVDEGRKTKDEYALSRFVLRLSSFVTTTRLLALLLAGTCLGLALQTYHTGRLAPVSAALLGLFLLARAPQRWRWWLAGGLVAALAFTLVASGLLGYVLSQRAQFERRVGGVALLGREDSQSSNRAPLRVLDDSIGRHVQMFNLRGDQNGRHHAPERPMLDFVSGLGFLAGLAVCVRRWHDWRSQYLLAALLLGLLPGLLSVDSPHAMRTIDALPFACAIGALGLVWLGRLGAAAGMLPLAAVGSRQSAVLPGTADCRLPTADRPTNVLALPRWLGPAAGALVVGLALAGNAWTYFRVMPPDQRVWTSFYPIHTQVGVFLRDLANERGAQALGQVFVPARLSTNQVFTYLAAGLPVQTFDEQAASAPAGPGALFVLSGYTTPQETGPIIERMRLNPSPVLFGPLLPDGVTYSFVVYVRA